MRALVAIALAVLLFGLGYFAGHRNRGQPEGSAELSVKAPVRTVKDSSGLSSGGAHNQATEAREFGFDDPVALVTEAGEGMSMRGFIAALEAAEGMDASQYKEAIAYFNENRPEGLPGLFAVMSIYMGWAEKDPQAALSYALQQEAEGGTANTYVIMQAWGQRDFNGAYAAVEQLGSEQQKRNARTALIHLLAQSDPQRALNLIAADDQLDENLTASVYTIWSKDDPQGAWQSIQQLGNQQVRERSIRRYFETMASKDPMGAATLAMENLQGSELRNTLSSVASYWIRKDADEALTYYEHILDPTLRNAMADDIARTLAQEDPERGFYWALDNVKGRNTRYLFDNLVRNMGQQDPQRAAQIIEDLPYGENYSQSVKVLAREWTEKDPEAAVNWIYSLPEGQERADAFRYFADTYARQNPEAALQYAQQFPPGEERTRLLVEVGQAKADADPMSAIHWAATLGDEQLNQRIVGDSLKRWARNDPGAVMSFIQANPQVPLNDRIFSDIAENMMNANVSEAAYWSQTLPENAQKRAIERISKEWLRQDTYAASVWIAQLPESPAKQEALGNLVNQIYRTEPDAAFDWALALENAKERKRAIKRIVGEWKKQDATTAWQSVNASTLPDDEKQALLDQLKN